MARKRKRDAGNAPETEIDREEELFIQEVNEELKQERYLQTWKKYGQYIVGGALLAVGSANRRFPTRELFAPESRVVGVMVRGAWLVEPERA